MSNPKRRALAQSKRRKQAERAAIQAARAQGCTCDVDVVFLDDINVQLQHDDWCPLVRVMEERLPGQRQQGVIYRRDEGA